MGANMEQIRFWFYVFFVFWDLFEFVVSLS